MAERGRTLWGLFYKGTNPLMRVEPSWPNHAPVAPPFTVYRSENLKLNSSWELNHHHYCHSTSSEVSLELRYSAIHIFVIICSVPWIMFYFFTWVCSDFIAFYLVSNIFLMPSYIWTPQSSSRHLRANLYFDCQIFFPVSTKVQKYHLIKWRRQVFLHDKILVTTN